MATMYRNPGSKPWHMVDQVGLEPLPVSPLKSFACRAFSDRVSRVCHPTSTHSNEYFFSFISKYCKILLDLTAGTLNSVPQPLSPELQYPGHTYIIWLEYGGQNTGICSRASCSFRTASTGWRPEPRRRHHHHSIRPNQHCDYFGRTQNLGTVKNDTEDRMGRHTNHNSAGEWAVTE